MSTIQATYNELALKDVRKAEAFLSEVLASADEKQTVRAGFREAHCTDPAVLATAHG